MNYHFFNPVLLRSPAFSYEQYALEKAGAIAKDPRFQLGLYLASPQLYELLEARNWDYASLSAKERSSIKKYYNRMSYRPTPFGAFSSFTLTEWGAGEPILLDDLNYKLHLKIDQDIAVQLAGLLTGNASNQYQYACNPSLYKAGGEFRFIKTKYGGGVAGTLFDLESYECNPLTTSLINYCSRGIRYESEIISFIMTTAGSDITLAKDYFDFLVEAQIIIADTVNNIIGDEHLQLLLDHPGIAGSPFKRSLEDICRQLETVTFRSADQFTGISEQLAGLISGLPTANSKQFFYAAQEKKVITGNVAPVYQQLIIDGLHALEALALPAQPGLLQQFIQDFKNRYDRRKVPLLEAIDPETGVGYGGLTHSPAETELLRQVNFNGQQHTGTILEWSAAHRLLLNKWNQSAHNNEPILLDDDDIAAIASPQRLQPPPTLSVIFRVIDDHIFLENAGGASATALAGRFTAYSGEVHDLNRRVAAKEQSANPNVIFADIGQLSDTHADNINRRRHSYDYEIPINVVSTLPLAHQINLADLWLSVSGNELVLESALHKKVIIPRLSTAYNYNRNQLAVFRLLCDLQYQGLQGSYTFELERYFPGMNHYPRVVFKNVILSPAAWHLSGDDLDELNSLKEQPAMEQFTVLRKKNKIPANIALVRFDQQLVFNTDCEEDTRFLLQCLKGLDKAVLQESFLPRQSIVYNQDRLPLVNQFIAFLYRKEQVYNGHTLTGPAAAKQEGNAFIIGSKWLYLKLYCAPAFANELLTKKLIPFFKRFGEEILSWFFIRFNDSGYHIRLRVRVNTESIGRMLSELKKRLGGAVHYHLIREYQADTYRREMERYGPDIIVLVENFFYGSSKLVLSYIKVTGLKSFRHSYHSLAFVTVDYLLHSFMPEINAQVTFLEQMVNTFYAEFSTDKALRIDLDLKYRQIKPEIDNLLSNPNYYRKLKLDEWQDLFNSTTIAIVKASVSFTTKRSNQLLADLIHMHLNRLFVERQRNQELIVYYCIYKHKRSIKAMAGKHRLLTAL